jgi:hypothetical protein
MPGLLYLTCQGPNLTSYFSGNDNVHAYGYRATMPWSLTLLSAEQGTTCTLDTVK